jgi:hypothetical protein
LVVLFVHLLFNETDFVWINKLVELQSDDKGEDRDKDGRGEKRPRSGKGWHGKNEPNAVKPQEIVIIK